MKRILQLDGGGAKGIIQVEMLMKLEQDLGKPLCEVFDLIIGTSVGTIVGAMIASGKISMKELHTIMNNTVKKVFTKKGIPLLKFFSNKPLYDRNIVIDAAKQVLGPNFKLKDCKTRFMSTTVSANDCKNHFMKSWENKDGNRLLVDVMAYSFAAPSYFGLINSDADQTTYGDGGVGNSNCSLDEAIIESVLQHWIPTEKVHVLSLGCGYGPVSHSYSETAKWGNLKSITKFYSDLDDGGLARVQSTKTKEFLFNALLPLLDNVSINRINPDILAEHDKMDAIEFIPQYQGYGKAWYYMIDINALR